MNRHLQWRADESVAEITEADVQNEIAIGKIRVICYVIISWSLILLI